MLDIIAQMAGVGMFEEDWAVPVTCPAAAQGGGKPRRRELTRFTSECPAPQQAPLARTEALHECPTPPQGGGKPTGQGKPCPYYTRVWQADLAGYVCLLVYFQSGL